MIRVPLLRLLTAGTLSVASLACGVGPTEDDINQALERTLESVNGGWTGTIGSNQATLAFTLTQGSGNAVTGTGTMKHVDASSSSAITISGTFQRPVLSLTFQGMVYEGTTVQGVMQGSYTTVAGISTQIRMTGTNFDRTLPILISEN